MGRARQEVDIGVTGYVEVKVARVESGTKSEKKSILGGFSLVFFYVFLLILFQNPFFCFSFLFSVFKLRTMLRRALGLALAYFCYFKTIYYARCVRDPCPRRKDRWAERRAGDSDWKKKKVYFRTRPEVP